MAKPVLGSETNRYKQLIEKIFFDRYEKGVTSIDWARDDLVKTAKALKIDLPLNLGDVIYALRYRLPMPDSITSTASKGMEWITVCHMNQHLSGCLIADHAGRWNDQQISLGHKEVHGIYEQMEGE